MKRFFKKLFYRLGYARRKMQAPGKLRRLRSQLEEISRANGPGTCKSPDEMMAELLDLCRTRHVLPIRDLLDDYYTLGLHRCGTKPSDYVFAKEWKAVIEPLMERLDPELLASVDDKHAHCALFRRHGFRVPAVLGMLSLREGEPVICRDEAEAAPIALMELLRERHALFCKPLAETQGIGCLLLKELPDEGKLSVNGETLSLKAFVQEHLSECSRLLVEEVVQQHEMLAAFHPSSLNTLRIWTFWMKDGPEYIGCALRMGQGGAHVDNAHQGGFIVDVRPDGSLEAEGYVISPILPKRYTEHPDSHIAFDGLKIPFFEEVKEMVCAAHRLYPREVFDLGWDIAITPEGPLIVEVNTGASITGLQRTRRPAGAPDWKELFYERFIPEIQAIIRG